MTSDPNPKGDQMIDQVLFRYLVIDPIELPSTSISHRATPTLSEASTKSW